MILWLQIKFEFYFRGEIKIYLFIVENASVFYFSFIHWLLSAKKSAKRKLPQINFDDCQIDDEPLPKYLVQIGVDETEVHRRVSCFVDRKREEIDINNIRDFINNEKISTEAESSCARVDSTVYRKGIGNHLKGATMQNW